MSSSNSEEQKSHPHEKVPIENIAPDSYTKNFPMTIQVHPYFNPGDTQNMPHLIYECSY